MARIMLAPMPFTGHVTPLLAVAEALLARGHDVRVYTGSTFRERVERIGARFVPWTRAPDFDEHDLPATFPRLRGKKGLGQVLTNMADLFIGTSPCRSPTWPTPPNGSRGTCSPPTRRRSRRRCTPSAAGAGGRRSPCCR